MLSEGRSAHVVARLDEFSEPVLRIAVSGVSYPGTGGEGGRLNRQQVVRFPLVRGVPLAPGDLVRLRNGQGLTVRSLRFMATAGGTCWIAIDANGISWDPKEIAEILPRNGGPGK